MRVDTKALLDLLPDIVVAIEDDGTVTYASASIHRILGWRPEEVLGRSAFDFVHPDERGQAMVEIAAQVDAPPGSPRRHHVELHASDDRFVKFEMLAAVAPGTDGLLLVLRDISEREAQQKELHRSDEQLRALTENVPDAVGRFDDRATLVFTSRRFRETVAQHPQLVDTWTAHAQAVLDSGAQLEVEVEVASEANWSGPGGGATPRWLASRFVPECDPEGAVTHVLVIASDVTLRKEKELRLLRAASYDPLTGLLNRERFQELAERSLERLAEDDGTNDAITLLFIDLDDFKAVNDTHGHLAGDDVLVAVGRRLAALVRPRDLVGRYGGDEFLMMCHGITADGAASIADRIVHNICEPISVAGATVRVGASVGMAAATDVATTFADLVMAADGAMYRAKTAGSERPR